VVFGFTCLFALLCSFGVGWLYVVWCVHRCGWFGLDFVFALQFYDFSYILLLVVGSGWADVVGTCVFCVFAWVGL